MASKFRLKEYPIRPGALFLERKPSWWPFFIPVKNPSGFGYACAPAYDTSFLLDWASKKFGTDLRHLAL